MNLHDALAPTSIPLWFLALSLFLPRVCIAIAFLQRAMPVQIPAAVGIVPILLWLILPRLLILFWIYNAMGVGIWFILHLVALVIAWGGGSSRVVRRRRVVEVVD